MAKPIQAVSAYRPRIKAHGRATINEVADYMAKRSTLTAGQLKGALSDYAEALLFFALEGQTVEHEALGTFKLSISLDDTVELQFTPAPACARRLNADFRRVAENVEHTESLGQTRADLSARWNREHPNDLITE